MFSKYFFVNTTTENFLKSVQDITELFGLVAVNVFAESFNATILKIKCQANKNIFSLSIEFFQAEQRKIYQEDFSRENLPTHKLKHLFKFHLFLILKKVFPEQKISWGILRGVRPLKLVHNILAQGAAEKKLPQILVDNYLLEAEQAKLLSSIAKLQQPLLADKEAVALYINIPYCPSKCTYCSFPSAILPAEKSVRMNFLRALEQDMIDVYNLKKSLALKIVAVYIGGGTPSCLPLDEFTHLLNLVSKYFLDEVVREFTVEAGRPDTITPEKIQVMKTFGVTRVSINPQTMNNKTLRRISREHTVEDFFLVYEQLLHTNSFTLNMDLILGLPGESLEDVQRTLEKSLQLLPDNLTVHTLALKKQATLFYQREELPAATLTEKMLKLSYQLLPQANYLPYYLYRQKYILANLENIGYTQKAKECLYNILVMEERHHLIGIGPNSASKAVLGENKLSKFYMPKNIETYLENLALNFVRRAEIFGQQ